LLFSCLYSPVFVFLNTLEDIILKGDGLWCELYTCVCIVICFQPSHARLLRLLSYRRNSCEFFFCHLTVAAFLCQNYLHRQWLTLRNEPRVFDTAIICLLVALAYAATRSSRSLVLQGCWDFFLQNRSWVSLYWS
jgi:hypothetical protein